MAVHVAMINVSWSALILLVFPTLALKTVPLNQLFQFEKAKEKNMI